MNWLQDFIERFYDKKGIICLSLALISEFQTR